MNRISLKSGIVIRVPTIIGRKLRELKRELMRAPALMTLSVVLLAGMMPFSLQANYLQNADFKEDSQLWHGDGQAAFLLPDGTEGAEGDKGAIPVIRIHLSKGQSRVVYQEFQPKDTPARLHAHVQAFASLDFKRSQRASDYQSGDSLSNMPTADFLVRLLPEYLEKTINLKPGQWVDVTCQWKVPTPSDDRIIYFMVPPGEGTVYIRNPSVTP